MSRTDRGAQQFSLRSSLDVTAQVQLDVGLRWVDTLHNNNGPTAGTVPSYFGTDMRVGWQLNPKLELSVVGQNLLHNRHPEFGFPDPTRVEIERSVFGRVQCRF